MKVLCVDDSLLRRTMLTKGISADSRIEVATVGLDSRDLIEKLADFRPDLITLDLAVGRGEALAILEGLLKRHPGAKIVVVGSLTTREAVMALRALELGAVEMLARPLIEAASFLPAAREEVIACLHRAEKSKRLDRRSPAAIAMPCPHGSTRPTPAEGTAKAVLTFTCGTGGPEALKEVLPKFPANVPATLVLTHLPSAFSRVLGEALQKLCSFEVKEVEEGDFVLPGRALLVPEGSALELVRDGTHLRLQAADHSASAATATERLLRSIAARVGEHAYGIALTGYADGAAAGFEAMQAHGARVMRQSEATCALYGTGAELAPSYESVDLEILAVNLLRDLETRLAA